MDALYSGDYPQTIGALHRPSEGKTLTGNDAPAGFCCLGVACDLYIKANPSEIERGIEDLEKEGRVFSYTTDFGDTYTELPEKVRDWLGLENVEGEMLVEIAGYRSLAGLNDSGFSFEEIAEIIEAEPAGLFKEE